MSSLAPATLDSNVLGLRLRELAGEERNVQVDFLLHFDEFERRRAFVETGLTPSMPDRTARWAARRTATACTVGSPGCDE